jgi:membrane-bound lytic murein transglycosylase
MKKALTATINVIMYAEFDNVIEIDRNRQVLFDYSAYMNTLEIDHVLKTHPSRKPLEREALLWDRNILLYNWHQCIGLPSVFPVDRPFRVPYQSRMYV